ncbi:hypothetical protein SK128_000003, partial [Halocaridina rubra]
MLIYQIYPCSPACRKSRLNGAERGDWESPPLYSLPAVSQGGEGGEGDAKAETDAEAEAEAEAIAEDDTFEAEAEAEDEADDEAEDEG